MKPVATAASTEVGTAYSASAGTLLWQLRQKTPHVVFMLSRKNGKKRNIMWVYTRAILPFVVCVLLRYAREVNAIVSDIRTRNILSGPIMLAAPKHVGELNRGSIILSTLLGKSLVEVIHGYRAEILYQLIHGLVDH